MRRKKAVRFHQCCYNSLKRTSTYGNIGPKQDRASKMRENEEFQSGKMENELELQKANKTKAQVPEDIAGRKDKGSMTGLLQKLTPDKSNKQL